LLINFTVFFLKALIEFCHPDTLPTGSKLGTVVAIHGAPGSHKDFKYITPLLQNKGIRFIGVNMPGFGFTPVFLDDPRLQCNNTERNSFVNELIAKIGNVEKLVVMGHSRGSENAIAIAESLVGLVLVNPTGLQRHRAQRPFWVVEFVLWLYSLGPTAKKVLHPFMKYFYNNVIGLRLDTGERAMMWIRAHIESINKCKNARVLVVYAGKDMLIETKIPHELACSFDGHIDLVSALL
ncbi:unnamed protein product, partial [Haemonchus placei]|uniref:AB hydrolase-1 domain-containing protein n=1 Tax=Haemonchus placei TaxID=6290 RepID=A0A0N4WQB7_HAEPC